MLIVHLTSFFRPLAISTVTVAAAFLAVMGIAQAVARRSERRYPDDGAHVEVDGVRLRYTDQGTGRPVVLIHGLLGSGYDFELGLAGRLATRFRVVTFDRPGNGYSRTRQPVDQSPFQQAALLRAAARRLGIEQPLLVGYSLGAPVAMAWAELYPDEVAAVVSVSGHVLPYALAYARLVKILRLPVLGRLFSEIASLPFGGPVGRVVLALACSPAPLPDAYRQAGLAMGLRPETLRNAILDLDHVCGDLRLLAANYRRVRLPVVVVGGVRDRISPFAESDLFSRRLPNARLIAVPDGGHALHVTHPERIVAAVDLAAELAETNGPHPVGQRERGLSYSAPSQPDALAGEAVA